MKRTYEYPDEIVTCRTCNGEGYVINKYGQSTCRTCEGAGKLRRKVTVIVDLKPFNEKDMQWN